jgi:hypothetical protein
MRQFLESHKAGEAKETNIMGYLNNRRLPTYYVGVDMNIRRQVGEYMEQVLSDWIDPEVYSGPTELDQTSVYGLRRYVCPAFVNRSLTKTCALERFHRTHHARTHARRYVNGSTLQQHVDRLDTHAISAILQVGVEDVKEPWPLVIRDHDGARHEVFMQPGEMVLYESARLVHGRPKPFNGKSYYNLFVHFRPKTGWDF